MHRNDGHVNTFQNGVFTFQFAFKVSLDYQRYLPQQLY
jgi:hypothetical protein